MTVGPDYAPPQGIRSLRRHSPPRHLGRGPSVPIPLRPIRAVRGQELHGRPCLRIEEFYVDEPERE